MQVLFWNRQQVAKMTDFYLVTTTRLRTGGSLVPGAQEEAEVKGQDISFSNAQYDGNS